MIWLAISLWTIGSCAAAWCLWREFPGADGQTLAVWFQAVGSIAAIFVAFMVGREQSRAALRVVMEERHERRRSIVAVAGAAAEHARRIGEVLDKGDSGVPGHPMMYTVYDKSIVDGLVHALSDSPAHEVGSPEGVVALLLLRDQVAFLGAQMEEYLKGPWNHPEHRKSIESCGDNVEHQRLTVAQAQETLEKSVRQRLQAIRQRYDELQKAVARVAQ